ncbi:MAG: CHAT domain-containing protein [Candidatus Methylumidiphilus sp.]
MTHPAPVILLAFANDRTHGSESRRYLAVATESRQIREALHPAEEAGACAVEVLPDATAEDIVRAFQSPRLRGRIAVLHFAGHADPSDLDMETTNGGIAKVSGQSLAAFLGTQPELTLVFINGCNSLDLAKRLLPQGVGVVIGSTEALEDDWAAHFATVFYRALAGGCTLAQAFQEAKTAPRGQALPEFTEGRRRSIGGIHDDSPPPEAPWQLEPAPNFEHLKDWRLHDWRYDPLRDLPLPKTTRPKDPFHLGLLQGYDSPHAPAFFGRRAIIRQLYDQLASAETQPIALFCGQSGVGKSSVLAAGLLPRLGKHFSEPVHLRRPPQTGLVAALIEAIGPGATLAEAWRGREQRDGKPLLVVLDQMEELLLNLASGSEWQSLLAALEDLFQTPEHWPQGKLLLGLRKEWLAELEQGLRDHRLPFEKMTLLQRLGKDDIQAIFDGAAREYGLRLTPANLPERIAAELLTDPDSPVAPTLQILLSQLWQDATRTDLHHPQFTEEQYETLRRQGLHLQDFLDRELAELNRQHPAWHRSDLALDVLNAHTTDLDFAAERAEQDLQRHFPRLAQELPKVLAYFKDRFLLAEAARQGRDAGRATRLVHDTLAPLVRRKWRERKQQQELRKERRRTLVAWTAAGVLLVAVGWGLWWWDANYRKCVEYYAEFIIHSGTIDGIKPLSNEEMSHREKYFSLIRYGRSNPVTEIRIGTDIETCYLNTEEVAKSDSIAYRANDLACLYRLEWIGTKRIASISYFNEKGLIEKQTMYDISSSQGWNDMIEPQSFFKINFFGLKVVISKDSYNADEDQLNRIYSAENFHNLTTIERLIQSSQQDNKMIFSRLYSNAYANNTKKDFCIDYITCYEFYADNYGRLIQYKDDLGQFAQRFDDWGNLIEQSYFDKDGLPIKRNYGYAKLIERNDTWGNLVEVNHLDEHGNLVNNADGYAKLVLERDNRGRLTKEIYYDHNNHLTQRNGRYAKLVRHFNKSGNLIEAAYFNEQEKPMLFKEVGAAKILIDYNEANEIIQQCKLDEEGRLLKAGKVIGAITNESQAAKLGDNGLQIGDEVELYDGVPIRDGEHLAEITSQPSEGTHELVVLRNGKRISFNFSSGKIGIVLTGQIATSDPCPIRN